MKRPLFIPATATLVSLACLALVALYPGGPPDAGPPMPAEGAFQVQVTRPRITRPLYGILPSGLEARLSGQPADLGFSQASEGAGSDTILPDQVEFHARDWRLRIQVGADGHITEATVLEVPLVLGGRARRLRCTPGPSPVGHLHTRAEGDRLSGTFEVSLSQASDADTGRLLRWPPAPLKVVGRFERVPRNSGPKPVSGR